MSTNKLGGQAVTKEAAEYCFRSIIQLMNGDTNKFKKYQDKAINLNNKLSTNVVDCKYIRKGKKIKAKLDMLTGEIRDLQGNIMREGVS